MEINEIIQVLQRFDTSALALTQRRRRDKQDKYYSIEDEYDVQDLLFAVLKPSIPDLAIEDHVPQIAGISGRVDLSSRNQGLVIEIKYAATSSRAAIIPRECSERLAIYSRWPGLNYLIFFVYDPLRHLRNTDNFILDMSMPTCRLGDAIFSSVAIVSPWQAGSTLASQSQPHPPSLPEPIQSQEESEDQFNIGIGAISYIPTQHAVFIPATVQNNSDRPNAITAISLIINNIEYHPSSGPADLGVSGLSWLPPRDIRLQPWDSLSGAWYFGRRFMESQQEIQISDRTTAILRINLLRGEPLEATMEILPIENRTDVSRGNGDDPLSGL